MEWHKSAGRYPGRSAGARLLAAMVVVAGAAGGCVSNYAVDVRNQTPQPLYAMLSEHTDTGAMIRQSKRLGPGDRAAIGPIRAKHGRAFLVVDTNPNPDRPVTVDLQAGTTTCEVTQEGEGTAGPLVVRVLR